MYYGYSGGKLYGLDTPIYSTYPTTIEEFMTLHYCSYAPLEEVSIFFLNNY